MNLFVKSHLQLAPAQVKEEAQTVEMPVGEGPSRVLKPVRARPIQRHLLLANQNMEKFMGPQSSDSDDPCGHVLRRLRTQQGLEAFVVASRACISVWQLCELETGKDSLFYTPGLRHKAAQRVAAILGSNWDDILAGRVAVKANSSPAARLHLLKSAAAITPLKPAAPAPVWASPQGSTQPQTLDATPLSGAVFLRVAQTQD